MLNVSGMFFIAKLMNGKRWQIPVTPPEARLLFAITI